MAESKYQARLIKDLKKRFGCFIVKNDTGYLQGVPDLTLYFPGWWAMLEVKDYLDAKRQPNQPYYVAFFNEMSFAAFICPENEEEVLDELERAWRAHEKSRGNPRVS